MFRGLEPPTAGLFGDSFGGLNALFSGLAFVALVVTLIMQGQELRLQRQELSLQRREMREQRDEMAKAAAAQQRSHEMIGIQGEIVALTTLLESNRRLIERGNFADSRWDLIKEQPEGAKIIALTLTIEALQDHLKELRPNHPRQSEFMAALHKKAVGKTSDRRSAAPEGSESAGGS